jgi:TetR/AcrR family transcriptional regulator, transcriptional repressor for nem operon
MARPSKFDRDTAIETAMQALWRHGYKANSVKGLSGALGITRSSFYNAFGDREDLFRRAMQHYSTQTPDRPFHEADRNVRFRPLLTATFYDICRVRAADPDRRGCLAVNSVAELCGSHETLGPFMALCMEKSLARIEELVGWAVERGELPANTDVRALALAINNLLVGVNVMAKIVGDEAELWGIAKTTLKALDLYEDAT